MKRNPRERIVRSSSPAPTLAYAEVETVLARVFDAEDAQPTAFRARLKHFRKLGIPAKNPGKGTRLRYSQSDLFQLLVALELSEFDVDPVLIVKIIQRHWTLGSGFWEAIRQAWEAIRQANQRPADDCLALVRPRFMSASLGQRKIVRSAIGMSLRAAPNPVEIHFVWASRANLIEALREPGERLCVFNLSARIRAVIANLQQVLP
jgi:hypothetical protein